MGPAATETGPPHVDVTRHLTQGSHVYQGGGGVGQAHIGVAMSEKQEQTASGGRRVLVVMAHPDDVEYNVAGTVARWVDEGAVVTYVLVTDGDKGSSDPTMVPERLAALRREEQRAAADVLGVREVVFLGYEDGMVQPTLTLRRDLTRVIRRYKPDAVICPDPTTRWYAQEYLNHPDHRAVGDTCLDAIYPCARDPLTFPDLLLEGLQPHEVSEVYLTMTSFADCWVDVSATMERKLRALREHRSQIGDGTEEMVIRWSRENAKGRDGVDYAEAFKYFRLG